MNAPWNTVETHLLFDYYGALLTERQQKVLTLRFFDDLTLAEVAQELDISRQAVHDLVHRTVDQLRDYECKLGLIVEQRRRQKVFEEVIVRLKDELNVTDDVISVLRTFLES